MEIRELNRGDAAKAMEAWIASYPNEPILDDEYILLRKDLQSLFDKVMRKSEDDTVRSREYFIDSQFGILIYLYLKKQSWFSVRLASNDGFWRYLSLKVIPKAVSERWGKGNDDHYWSKPNRIWLKQIWWYVHLSWNKNEEITRRIIESPNCSTDTILNFVERTGRKGTSVDAYRFIIKLYSEIPTQEVSRYRKSKKNDDLFRVVMKLHTAKAMVVEPAFCIGGCEGYARKLFLDAGFDIDSFL